jgi:hypothetical protein
MSVAFAKLGALVDSLFPVGFLEVGIRGIRRDLKEVVEFAARVVS